MEFIEIAGRDLSFIQQEYYQSCLIIAMYNSFGKVGRTVLSMEIYSLNGESMVIKQV